MRSLERMSVLACLFGEFLTGSTIVFELDRSGQPFDAEVERGGKLPLGVFPTSAQ